VEVVGATGAAEGTAKAVELEGAEEEDEAGTAGSTMTTSCKKRIGTEGGTNELGIIRGRREAAEMG